MRVELLARQHHIFTEGKERHIVDMVFHDRRANDLILVELKRGRLDSSHVAQLARYMANARESKLMRAMLDRGATLRGILATVEPCEFKPGQKNIIARVIDRQRVIKILRHLRESREG
jgi:hypothetical protein